MDDRGNKLFSCKIPDQYLKKQKKILNFQNSGHLWKKENYSEYKRVVITTLKI